MMMMVMVMVMTMVMMMMVVIMVMVMMMVVVIMVMVMVMVMVQECWNPTEGGGYIDGTGLTSSSILENIRYMIHDRNDFKV